jgi:hypothetical protein
MGKQSLERQLPDNEVKAVGRMIRTSQYKLNLVTAGSDETGDVPGFRSVATAMDTPAARSNSIGGFCCSRPRARTSSLGPTADIDSPLASGVRAPRSCSSISASTSSDERRSRGRGCAVGGRGRAGFRRRLGAREILA